MQRMSDTARTSADTYTARLRRRHTADDTPAENDDDTDTTPESDTE
jgi:hypothetical protein